MRSFVVEPEYYISQMALPEWEALAEVLRDFFSPFSFDTSNLSNGASAASAAQNSWDLAIKTADYSDGTAGVEQQQSSQVTGSFSSLGSTTASVELWTPGLLLCQ